MQRSSVISLAGMTIASGLLLATIAVNAMPPEAAPAAETAEKKEDAQENPAPTEVEARGRARLLHETFHATLQFVHDEYYHPNERLTLPATTLERVFRELASRRNVKLHWLAVNAKAMNVDHNPQDEFEKNSVTALTAGKDEFEAVENGVYRHAGAITLSSDCLKCHLPGRTSNKDRVAALVISIPLQPTK
ncbi:MAG: DUF3365 domain-containing protein [Planctomycetota bacterium]